MQVRGEVKAVRSIPLTAPSSAGDLQILELAKNGANVKKGDVVVKFDPVPVQRTHAEKLSELKQAEEEIGKTEAQYRIQEQQAQHGPRESALRRAACGARRGHAGIPAPARRRAEEGRAGQREGEAPRSGAQAEGAARHHQGGSRQQTAEARQGAIGRAAGGAAARRAGARDARRRRRRRSCRTGARVARRPSSRRATVPGRVRSLPTCPTWRRCGSPRVSRRRSAAACSPVRRWSCARMRCPIAS